MAGTLFAAESGAGNETLILLHGFGGTHRAWDAVIERLPRSIRAIAYDLPGHGQSLDYPGAGPVKVAAQAVIDDLDSRGVGRFHLAGHSMGGAVACLIALTVPELVKSLTLLAPGGFGPEINMRALERYAAATEPADIRLALEQLYGWYADIPDEAVEWLTESRCAPGQSEMLKSIAANMTRDGKQGVIPRDRLAALTMPIAIGWGELDNILPFKQTRELPANFALRTCADAGHMLPDEKAENIARLLAEQCR